MRRSLLLRAASVLAGLAAVCALPACGEALPNGVVLDRPRLLGARVHIEADPERAQPRPGEAVSVQWIVAPDDGMWRSAVTACVLAPANTGLPGCAGAPFAIAQTEPSSAPSFELTVPEDAVRGVLVAGVLCESGQPDLTGELPGCSGDDATAEPLLFSFSLAPPEGPPNQHPRIEDAPFTFNEMPWDAPPAELPETGCAMRPDGASLPHIPLRVDDEPETIAVQIDPSTREPYFELILGEPPMQVEREEELRISHVATAGRFARLVTQVFDEETLNARAAWRHPDAQEVPQSGLLVRFFFVVRDPRGGMDRADRALCLVP